jgi:hypothetical protein
MAPDSRQRLGTGEQTTCVPGLDVVRHVQGRGDINVLKSHYPLVLSERNSLRWEK